MATGSDRLRHADGEKVAKDGPLCNAQGRGAQRLHARPRACAARAVRPGPDGGLGSDPWGRVLGAACRATNEGHGPPGAEQMVPGGRSSPTPGPPARPPLAPRSPSAEGAAQAAPCLVVYDPGWLV